MSEIKSIYRYPVKGLSAEALQEALLAAGHGIKNDRRFAIAPGSTSATQNTGQWIAKNFFLMLARNPKLAQLSTVFDDDTETLTISRRGKQISRGKLTDPIGRALIEDFFTAFMGEEARGRPRLFEADEGHSLSDQSQPLISLINLKSVSDVERVTGSHLDPIRFRGNIYYDGAKPWEETELIGQTISIGTAALKIIAPTGRCVATHVNPETAERDVNILKALQSGFRHTDCGVFAEVVQSGRIQLGDSITVR